MDRYKCKGGGSGILTALDTAMKTFIKEGEEWTIILMTDRNGDKL